MASSGSDSPVSPAASTPASSIRSTVSSWTASARSIAGSGSARKNRRFVLSAGATTMTSASWASSPTAFRRASADTGSETTARIFLPMRGLIPNVRSGAGLASPALDRTARETDGQNDLQARERELERAL